MILITGCVSLIIGSKMITHEMKESYQVCVEQYDNGLQRKINISGLQLVLGNGGLT